MSAESRWRSLAAGRKRDDDIRPSPAGAVLERTDRSSPDTRFFRATTATTAPSFAPVVPCGPDRIPAREVDGACDPLQSVTIASNRATYSGVACPRRALGT